MKLLLNGCPRCRGTVIVDDIDTSCMNCGYSPPYSDKEVAVFDEDLKRYVLVKKSLLSSR